MTFQMTAGAAREVLAAARRSGAEGMALRVAARTTPDGIAYGLGFDEAAPDDDVALVEGLTVLVAPPSRELLAGTVLDYVQLDGGAHDFAFLPAQDAGGAPSQGCGSGGCSRCG